MAEITVFHAIVLFVLIAFAGFVDCAAGGGGLITIPAYLSAGVPINVVIGTNKLSSAAGISFAVARLIKHLKVNWRHVMWAVMVSLIGALIGAHFSQYLTHLTIVILLLVLMPLLLMLNSHMHYADSATSAIDPHYFIKYLSIGFIFSAYDGFFGPGTGTFLFLGFIFLAKIPAREAVMNAKIVNLTANLSALAYFISVGRVDWYYAAIGVPAAIIGYTAGAHFVTRVNLKWLKQLVNVVIGCLIIKLLLSVV